LSDSESTDSRKEGTDERQSIGWCYEHGNENASTLKAEFRLSNRHAFSV